MASARCSECGEKIGNKSQKCIHCCHRLKRRDNIILIIGVCVIILLLYFIYKKMFLEETNFVIEETQSHENNSELIIINDLSDLTKAEVYKLGIDAFNNSDYEKSKYYLCGIRDFKDTSIYYDFSIQFSDLQGEWVFDRKIPNPTYTDYPSQIIVNGNLINIDGKEYLLRIADAPSNYKYLTVADENATGKFLCLKVDSMSITESNSYSKVLELDFMTFKNGIITILDTQFDAFYFSEKYKHNNMVDKLKDNPLMEPYIGMNSDEVRDSTWGEPKKVNKTTYTWGTTEQWCYSDYRYIYFENGVVIAISE